MTQPLFHLNIREVNEKTVVEFGGEVDAANAAQFAEVIGDTPGQRPLVVDLTTLDYIDSAGFAAVDRMLHAGTITIVLDPDSPIRAAAELIELPVHDTVQDAIRSWTQSR